MTPERDVCLRSALLLPLALLLLLPPSAPASGDVGCLFSEQVCPEEEECFDDLVIGRCVSVDSADEDLYRLGPLSGPAKELLDSEMRRVFSQGYTWEDSYSQCVFQTVLDHIQNREFYSAEECAHLVDVEAFPRLSPDQVHPDWAESSQALFDQGDTDLYSVADLQDAEFSEAEPGALFLLPSGEEPDFYPEEVLADLPEILPNSDNSLEDVGDMEDIPEVIPVMFDEDDLQAEVPDDTNPTFMHLQDLMDDLDGDDIQFDSNDDNILYDRPDKRGDNNNWVLLKDSGEDFADSEDTENGDTEDSKEDKDVAYEDVSPAEESMAYYDDDQDSQMETVFDRRERLDVKKPGPFFKNSQNNFFLDKLLSMEPSEENMDYSSEEDPGQTEYEMPLTMQNKEKKDLQMIKPLIKYEEVPDIKDSHLVVNIKDRFKTLRQAMLVVENLAKQLHVPPQAFGEPRLSTSRLRIPVQSNPRQLNATAMATLLGNQLETVNKRMADGVGVEVESFSTGNENDVISVYTGHSRLFLALFLLTAALASVLMVGGLLLVLRRQRKKKLKKAEDKEDAKEEPVKEYKQLVRDWSRSSRASQSSNGGPTQAGEEGGKGELRTRTISEDGGRSKGGQAVQGKQVAEASRTSSNSSWQEEPGVSTMDISTGHMVLSYMEDHLKNKQRLEQEWVGLCAYEAEQSATSVAFKIENKKKNKYPDKLPYDHNRVLLNALVNGSNSDYINASTVTDHDPRNPAYIVSQGPMAHTVADFWQMVWEQGTVVIVMLSRLSENGYQLAHRYWPDEGSQQYHIYEVHLVSEHVWCDDYLVRSLYLKNTQTGETRTVTQFHFLSWSDGSVPQSSKSLLEFRRKVNKSYRGRSCPIIIHCSDGVGRSGTYVLIDMVLNRMNKGSKEIDIAATLEHIRDQRSGMVQTKSQFEFCLTAVAEETHAILKSLSSQ